jgi:hypothetical protein
MPFENQYINQQRHYTCKGVYSFSKSKIQRNTSLWMKKNDFDDGVNLCKIIYFKN